MTSDSRLQPEARPRAVKWRSMAHVASWLATLVVIALSLTARLGGQAWPFELAGNFPVQYAWLAGAAWLAAACARAKVASLAAGLALIWQVSLIMPLYRAPDGPRGEGPPLRIMSLNVHTGNRLHARAIHAIREARPDVVFVLEVNERWMRALEPLRDEFPHWRALPREDNFGMAVLSRRPWTKLETLEFGSHQLPMLELELTHEGQAWTIVGVHPLPPVRRSTWLARNEQLEWLAARLPRERPLVLIGDLNLTSWSPPFDRLLEQAALRDSRLGYGVLATWPARFPLMRIPIDHALVSPQVEVVGRSVGQDIGSDHLPILVEVRAATSRSPAASR